MNQPSLSEIYSGRYTPVGSAGANVTSITEQELTYTKVGNSVIVDGSISIAPIAASTFTELFITLPIASNFTLYSDASGSIHESATGLPIGGISADSSLDEARLRLTPVSSSNLVYQIFFKYTIK